jgi:hypothetical protein
MTCFPVWGLTALWVSVTVAPKPWPTEVRLLHELRFLACLRRRLAVRYRHFDLPQQVSPLARVNTSCLVPCSLVVPVCLLSLVQIQAGHFSCDTTG